MTAKHLIPITVLTGYLGSGETTLLNHILQNNDGLKIGVIVNDFGDINIDSKLVASQSDNMMKLSNGCICCLAQSMELKDALAQFTHPEADIDYILIEASGLAEMEELVSNLSAAKYVGARLDGVVAVIDAENIEQNAKEHGAAVEQIEYSNFVIINKVDLVTPEKIIDIKNLVQMIKPKARVFEAVRGEIDPHIFLDQEAFEAHVHDKKKSHDHAQHEHTTFTTFSFTSDEPLEPARFQHFINEQMPLSIYRAKGFIDFGQKTRGLKATFQLVGTRTELTWSKWAFEEIHETALVFIGQNVDQAQVLTDLEYCIDPDPNGEIPPYSDLMLKSKLG